MDLGLARRSALVTGATGGIGAAVARALAGLGCRVAVGYHDNQDAAGKLVAELGPDRALAVRYALAEPDVARAAVDQVATAWDGPDILVTSAVRWGARRSPDLHIEDVPAQQWEPVVRDNLLPTIATVLAVAGGMRRRGWGRIVLVSSHVAADGQRGQEFYGAAKAALHGFARSLAWDVGPDGVLVNVVCPGLTSTERVVRGLPAHVREGERQRTATGRLSDPHDVANVIAFLCSPANGNITGETVTVAGGR